MRRGLSHLTAWILAYLVSAAMPCAAQGQDLTADADADAGVETIPEAQEDVAAAESGELSEIVVTAQRRKTNLQETPIAISAISGEDLNERGSSDLSGVTQATPNMQVTTSTQASGGSNFAQVFIRGVGQTDFYITKDPAVGIYVDGVYLARAPGALLELLDIERIELLRGPQGTLFGKNTAGGAIQVITKKPDGGFGGIAELRLGDYGRRDISGSFETSLVPERLFLRATGLSRHQDGYYERLRAAPIDPRTADGNSVDSHGGRLTLRWTPTDDIDVLISADATLQRQTATDYQAIGISQPANIGLYNRLVLAPRGEVYDSRWVAPRPWTTYSTGQSYNNSDVWGTSGALTWDLGSGVQLKSITAYRTLRASAKTDQDGTPFDIVASNGIVVEQNQVSEEVQVTGKLWDDKIAWVAGLWYFQEHANDTQSSRQLVGLFEALEAAPLRSIAVSETDAAMCPAEGTGPTTCLGGAANPANQRYDLTRQFARDLRARSYAAFGQASYQATEQLGFTAGARLSREEKDFTYFETLPLQADRVSFDHVKAKPSWNVFTPKLGAEYRFTPELMAYASFSVGFKAGGITGRPARADLFKAFDPEWLTTYEIGWKSEWFGRKARLNLAAFYSNYTDIQITRNTTDAQGMFVRLEQNAGDGNIKGFEAEAAATPLRGLELSAAVGFTHFEFTSLLPQDAAPGVKVLTLDNKLPFTPELTALFAASYRIELGEGGLIIPRADLNYGSSYFTDIDNTREISQGRYVTLNARLAYAPADQRWEAFAALTNITNEAIVASGVFGLANGSQIVSYRAPRMFYAGMRFNFD